MIKINHEEYQMLKELDDKWKWIAKIRGMGLVAFDIAPKKYGNSKDWAYARSSQRKELDRNLLQFVEYDDDYPYNIAELVEEYEDSKEYKDSLVIEYFLDKAKESEETEVKNKEELKSWFEDDKLYVGEYVKHKINQLDEPEVLSQEWIDKNKFEVNGWNEAVHVEDLQNLIVPKQELPVIPKFVAEAIEKDKGRGYDVYDSIDLIIETKGGGLPSVSDWVARNIDKYARAWLDGFTVEEEEGEQKYVIKISEHDYMVMDDEGFMYPADINVHKYKSEFTEQEIKDYDERYWAFRKPVEELEE